MQGLIRALVARVKTPIAGATSPTLAYLAFKDIATLSGVEAKGTPAAAAAAAAPGPISSPINSSESSRLLIAAAAGCGAVLACAFLLRAGRA